MNALQNSDRGAPDSVKTGDGTVDKLIDTAFGPAAPADPPAPAPAQPVPLQSEGVSKFLGRIPFGWVSTGSGRK
jgi:hypothetical protein